MSPVLSFAVHHFIYLERMISVSYHTGSQIHQALMQTIESKGIPVIQSAPCRIRMLQPHSHIPCRHHLTRAHDPHIPVTSCRGVQAAGLPSVRTPTVGGFCRRYGSGIRRSTRSSHHKAASFAQTACCPKEGGAQTLGSAHRQQEAPDSRGRASERYLSGSIDYITDPFEAARA